MKQTVVLINLGTPAAPTVAAVRNYLFEFLSDPYVINRPAWLRLPLAKLISWTRASQSLEAYEKIWTTEGSPLLVNTKKLTQALENKLPNTIKVAYAMRYGQPSIKQVITQLVEQGITDFFFMPLYPQYAESSYQTVVDEVVRVLKPYQVKADFLPPCFAESGYIAAERALIEPLKKRYKPDHLLFSFHGLPEEHITKLHPECADCLKQASCDCPVTRSQCYRQQCFETARTLAKQMDISDSDYSVAFQSRLGRLPWLQPYLDATVENFAKQGIKRLQIVSAAFTADCLETLEEIAMATKQRFIDAGGEDLQLTPSLNDSEQWVDFLYQKVTAWLDA